MTKRKNEFGIKCLFMYPLVAITDPTTLAKQQLKITVEFYPGDFLPVFVDVQNTIKQKIENHQMAIEAVADAIIDLFNDAYEPSGLKVKVETISNNMYFPIVVTAESGFIGSEEGDAKRAEKKKSTKAANKESVKLEDEKEDKDSE